MEWSEPWPFRHPSSARWNTTAASPAATGANSTPRVCLDPAQPPEPAVFVSCRDCLTYKIGVLRSLLQAGTSADILADQVTQHMRRIRGFDLSFGGYHMRAGGFWLNAIYYATCGMFLIDGSRSRATGSDLDLLLLAFRHGVAQAPDPRMTDPQLYTTQIVYVDFSSAVHPIQAKQDLLASPQCRQHPSSGFHRVTLAEFLPVSLAQPGAQPGALPVAQAAAQTAARAAPAGQQVTVPQQPAPGLIQATSAAATAASTVTAVRRGPPQAQNGGPRPLRLGDICPQCQTEVRERPLFSGTFIGCLC